MYETLTYCEIALLMQLWKACGLNPPVDLWQVAFERQRFVARMERAAR